MTQRRQIMLIGGGIALFLALLPALLSMLPPLIIPDPIGPIADAPPPVGMPEQVIWWSVFVGSSALGIGLGISLLALLFRKQQGVDQLLTSGVRLKLLVCLGASTLAIYVVNFLLPFPLRRFYNFVNLNYGKVAKVDVGMAIGVTAATIALFVLYYIAYRLCRGQSAYKLWVIVLGGALVFALVNFFVCTTTSLDIYDYIARGRITGLYHGNPYVYVPSDFPSDPFMQYPAWKDKTAAYGPLWETLSGLIGYVAGDQLLTHVLAHKDLALASYVLCVLMIALILRRVSPDRALAGTLLFAWNPLILMEGLQNAHNDLLMVGLILIGFWFLAQTDRTRKQNLSSKYRSWHLVLGGFAILFVWTGVLVKFIPFLLLPPLFLYALAKERKWGRWIGMGLLLLLPMAAFTFMYYRVFWHWPEVMDPILRRTDMFRLTIPSVIVSYWEKRIPKHIAQGYVSWSFLIVFAVSYLALMIRTAFIMYKMPNENGEGTRIKTPWQLAVDACLGAFLLYLLLASLWFWPWYLIWPIALLALSDDERLRIPLILAACASQLSHVGLNFVWYWFDELTWDTLYAVERPSTLLMVVPPLLAAIIAYWPPPTKPKPVRHASYLLYASILIGLFSLTMNPPDTGVKIEWISTVLRIFLLAIAPVLIVMMSKRENWARVGVIGVFALSCAYLARSIVQAPVANVLSSAVDIVRLALQVVAIILLVMNRSGAWFKPGMLGNKPPTGSPRT
jgi:hypothetical protein